MGHQCKPGVYPDVMNCIVMHHYRDYAPLCTRAECQYVMWCNVKAATAPARTGGSWKHTWAMLFLGGLWVLWKWLQLKMWVLGLFVKVLQRFSLEVHWWCRMTARIKVLPGCLAPTCCSRSLSGSATLGQLSWVRRPCAEGFNPIVDPSLPAKREISSCAYLISNTKYKIQNMEEQVGWLYISCTTHWANTHFTERPTN